MRLQLSGLRPLRFSSLEFIVKLDYRDQGKIKAKVRGHRDIKSSGFRFGSKDRRWSAIDDIRIVKSSTGRVLLYYAEDYI